MNTMGGRSVNYYRSGGPIPFNRGTPCPLCGGKGFKQTMMLKRLSALMSPTGQEALIPVAAFACEACGHINKEFLDAEIKNV